MKVLLVSLIPLFACILFPPSEVRAERDAPEERRKRETLTYVLNSTHSVEAYRKGNNVVIVRVFPQNNAGKKVDVTGDILPSVVSCKLGPDGKVIPGSKKPSVAVDNFKGSENMKKVCLLCQNLNDINDSECRTDRKAARRCVNTVKEMLNNVERELSKPQVK